MLTTVRKIFGLRDEATSVAQFVPEDIKTLFTPDIWKLEQFAAQLIFIPDDMKKGGKHHSFIEDYAVGHVGNQGLVHPACYTHEPFTFWKKDLGEHSYPIVLPHDYRPEGFTRFPVEEAPIKGELWAVRPQAFIFLDIHKENGVRFIRERVQIKYPYSQVKHDQFHPLPNISREYFKCVQAWMYIGIKKYWNDQIGGIFNSEMELREHREKRPWIDKFYNFEV